MFAFNGDYDLDAYTFSPVNVTILYVILLVILVIMMNVRRMPPFAPLLYTYIAQSLFLLFF